MKFFLLSFILIFNVFAEEGKVLKLEGTDALIVRDRQMIKVTVGQTLQEGDVLSSLGSTLLIHLYPTTQIAVDKNTMIRFEKNIIESTKKIEKSFSIVGIDKGLVRLKIDRDVDQEIDQKVITDGVSFSARGTDFEVFVNKTEVDLEVYEGLIEASSPFVHSFVPEMTKSKESLIFNLTERKFLRRKFAPRFAHAPAFLTKSELLKNWKKAKPATVKPKQKAKVAPKKKG